MLFVRFLILFSAIFLSFTGCSLVQSVDELRTSMIAVPPQPECFPEAQEIEGEAVHVMTNDCFIQWKHYVTQVEETRVIIEGVKDDLNDRLGYEPKPRRQYKEGK